MESKVDLYESMMVSSGKSREKIWGNLAKKVLVESYYKDKEIYGPETRELYGILFENSDLFESIDERAFMLNEEKTFAGSSKYDEPIAPGSGEKGYAGSSKLFDKVFDATKPSSGNNKSYDAGSRFVNSSEPKLTGFGAFAEKIKGFFETFGGNIAKYFSNGIAGVIANPLPLVAAGASAGLIVALVRKFKKLSDAKKEAAKAKLPTEMKKKLETTLGKDEADLKIELAKKEKTPEKKAASADTEKKKC